MKIKIDGKCVRVGFWSFMKCVLLVEVVFSAMLYGAIIIIGLSFG